MEAEKRTEVLVERMAKYGLDGNFVLSVISDALMGDVIWRERKKVAGIQAKAILGT